MLVAIPYMVRHGSRGLTPRHDLDMMVLQVGTCNAGR